MNVTKSIVADHVLWAKIETLAEKKTISVSALVRQAMQEKLEREKETK